MSDNTEGNVEFARLQTELVDADDKLRAIQELKKHRGYKLIVAYMQEQSNALAKKVIGTPCHTFDACLEQEYNKGVLQGLLQFELLTESQFVTLSDERDSLREQVEAYQHGD